MLFILSVLSHPIFILVYLIFLISYFISFNSSILIFIFSILLYFISFNKLIFESLIYLLSIFNFEYSILFYGNHSFEKHYDYLIFTLVLFILLIFKKIIILLNNEKNYKKIKILFHIFSSSILFFGYHNQFNRIIDVIWNFYPLIFMIVLNHLNINILKKNNLQTNLNKFY